MSDTARQPKNEWREKTNFLLNHAAQKRIPLSGTFEVTARCNLSCHMCYIRHDGTKEVLNAEKSTQEWIEMGEQAAEAGTLFLLITGGEPLIRKDFREIYEALNKMGFHLILFTNATLIDENFIKWISPIRPNKVGVTLYGASPETYQKVTGNAEGFYKAIKGLDLLMEAGINVELRNSVTKANVHELNQMQEIAKARGLNLNNSFTLLQSPRKSHSVTKDVRLTPQQIREISLNRLLEETDIEHPYSLQPDHESDIEQLFEKQNTTIPQQMKDGKTEEAMKCMAGKSSWLISWKGRMLPCAMIQEPFSNPFREGFLKAWQNLQDKISQIQAPQECIHCNYKHFCEVCPAKLKAETGEFTKLSTYICNLAKMRQKLSYDHNKIKQNIHNKHHK